MSDPKVSVEVLEILRRRYGGVIPGVDDCDGYGSGDDGAVRAYRYGNLTSAIADRTSPLRCYLDGTFPNTREVTTPHIRASPTIVVSGTPGVNPGTVGTAFDNLVALRFQPDAIPAAARPYAGRKPERASVWANLLGLVADDPTRIYAAAWAFALACESYRSRITPPAIDELVRLRGGYDELDLLGVAPVGATEELARLDEYAGTGLYPHLGTPCQPDPEVEPERRRAAAWGDLEPVVEAGVATGAATVAPTAADARFGPTFAASNLCLADADVIYRGTLFEIKTRLGATRKSGERADRLQKNDLYQAVTYTLFDTDDRFGLTHVALYSARYARLTRWPIPDLLHTLAGADVDLAEQRAIVWRLLGGGRRLPRSRKGKQSSGVGAKAPE